MKPLVRSAGLFVLCLVLGCSGDATSTTDAGSQDAAPTITTPSDAAPVCTPGKDWTCNDNPIISSIHGQCLADGTCQCPPQFPRNPATGKCL